MERGGALKAGAGSLVRITAKGLLFDMDGVLVSSLGSVERSWRRWAERHGMDFASTMRAAHGRRTIDSLRMLLPGADYDAELKMIEDLEVADNDGLKALDGVLAILHAIPAQSWTVVTSASERLARSRLQHGGIPIPDRMVTEEMVEHGKPSPEPYRKGAEILSLRPEDCVVIEDSGPGVASGHAAGARVLATTFSHSPAELPGADWIVKSLRDVTVSVAEDRKGVNLAFVNTIVRRSTT